MKKKEKIEPVSSETIKDKNIKKKIKQIKTLGQSQGGYITYLQLNELLPEDVLAPDLMENFILMLSQNGGGSGELGRGVQSDKGGPG